jgi:hypothetical protein
MTLADVRALAQKHVQAKYGMAIPIWMVTPLTKGQSYEIMARHFYETDDHGELARFLGIMERSGAYDKWWIVVFQITSQLDQSGLPRSISLLIEDNSGDINEFVDGYDTKNDI